MTRQEHLKSTMAPQTRETFEHYVKGQCEDAIHTDVEVRLNLRDRIRVLLTGRCRIEVVTYCENLPGLAVSETKFLPHLMFWRRKPACGYAEVGTAT